MSLLPVLHFYLVCNRSLAPKHCAEDFYALFINSVSISKVQQMSGKVLSFREALSAPRRQPALPWQAAG